MIRSEKPSLPAQAPPWGPAARSFRALGALACALLLFASAACDSNPTDVGGKLIGRQDVGPERVVLPLDVTDTTYAPVTGTASGPTLSAARFLAGQTTADPLGDTEATGYVDFLRTSTPAGLSALPIDTVEVQLTPNYFYGDTTRAATFSLHDLTEEWELGRGRADTSLAGIAETSAITTFSVEPSDTLVTVRLPGRWVREHASELKASGDSVFAQNFHGFQVRPEETSSVVGFASLSTSMRVVLAGGSDGEAPPEATFQLSRQLSTIRQPDPAQPDDRYVVQSGTGRTLAFDFDLPDSLRNASVNDATLLFEADTTFATNAGSFTRPRLDALQLYGTAVDGTPDENQEPRLLQGAQFSFNAEKSRFENGFPLVSFVQNLLLGTPELARFQLRPPPQIVRSRFGNVSVRVPSLSSALIRKDEGHRPRLVIVYTPTEK